jgi:hypothetical protein
VVDQAVGDVEGGAGSVADAAAAVAAGAVGEAELGDEEAVGDRSRVDQVGAARQGAVEGAHLGARRQLDRSRAVGDRAGQREELGRALDVPALERRRPRDHDLHVGGIDRAASATSASAALRRGRRGSGDLRAGRRRRAAAVVIAAAAGAQRDRRRQREHQRGERAEDDAVRRAAFHLCGDYARGARADAGFATQSTRAGRAQMPSSTIDSRDGVRATDTCDARRWQPVAPALRRPGGGVGGAARRVERGS